MKKNIIIGVLIILLIASAYEIQLLWHRDLELNEAISVRDTTIMAQVAAIEGQNQKISSQCNEIESLGSEVTKLNVELGEERQKIKWEDLRYFNSEDELRRFLQADQTNEMKYNREDFDCDDFAFMLCDNARKAGYIIYPMVVNYGWSYHMKCFTIIGNRIYSIEPQKDSFLTWGFID